MQEPQSMIFPVAPVHALGPWQILDGSEQLSVVASDGRAEGISVANKDGAPELSIDGGEVGNGQQLPGSRSLHSLSPTTAPSAKQLQQSSQLQESFPTVKVYPHIAEPHA